MACDHIRPGYRYLPEGAHLIFYRVTRDGTVDIVRIVHKRMRVSPALFPVP